MLKYANTLALKYFVIAIVVLLFPSVSYSRLITGTITADSLIKGTVMQDVIAQQTSPPEDAQQTSPPEDAQQTSPPEDAQQTSPPEDAQNKKIKESIYVSIDGPKNVESGNTVTLTGGHSQTIIDTATNAQLRPEDDVVYEWVQTGGPEIDYTLNNKEDKLMFHPSVNTQTEFTFKLTVHGDSTENSASKTVIVKPIESTSAGEKREYIKAHIDGPNAAKSGETVTLTGGYSQSIWDEVTNRTLSPEDEVLYEWDQTGGPKIDYTLNERANQIAFEPSVDNKTKFTFKLTVHGDIEESTTSKTVTLNPFVGSSGGSGTGSSSSGGSGTGSSSSGGSGTGSSSSGGSGTGSSSSGGSGGIEPSYIDYWLGEIVKNTKTPSLSLETIAVGSIVIIIIAVIAGILSRRHRKQYKPSLDEIIEISTEGGIEF
jgi:hypothetical protein